jgi:hypothetical protein
MAGPWRSRIGYHVRTITRQELERFKAGSELPPVGLLSAQPSDNEESTNELEQTTG